MSFAWPPPTGEPNPTPQPGIEPANPAVPPVVVPPVVAPPQSSWPPPQPAAFAPGAWPDPQHGAPPPNYWMPQQPPPDRALDWLIPVRRSGLSIAAGYVSLVSIFVWIAAPIGVVLGILALRDLKRQPHLLGKGRAWFAIVFGASVTLVLLAVIGWSVLRLSLGSS